MRTYDDDYPTCVKTFATLRFYHKEDSPEAVTEELGISPSKSQVKGMNFVNGRKVRRLISAWFLTTKSKVESKDARKHIDWILDQVRELECEIENLHREGWRADLNVYWVSIGHGGPMLDPEQMRDLAKLNLRCGFALYSSADSEHFADDNPS